PSCSGGRRLSAASIAGARAHVRGLGRAGILTQEEVSIVLAALNRVEEELAAGTFKFGPGDEDVHTAIERRVTELAGPAGAKIHAGRSRNDQVATDMRLFARRELTEVAEDLGFAARFENSLDAVSDRDFVAEALFDLALLAVHLSRLGEEIVLWSSEEFGFLHLDDAYATGSSMLPQKKNPDVAELARGKSGRLIGHLTGFLATLKSLPLAYNRDLQEDKEPLF